MTIHLHGQNEIIMSSRQRMAAMGMQKRSKRDSVILVHHTIAVHHSWRIIQDMEIRAWLIDWFKMQYLEKMLTKLILEVI